MERVEVRSKRRSVVEVEQCEGTRRERERDEEGEGRRRTADALNQQSDDSRRE